MTTSSVQSVIACSTITGNRVTMIGNSLTAPHSAGNTSGQPVATLKAQLEVQGDVHGMLRFPFADPETLEGALVPSELATAQVKLTQGGAGAVMAILVEEVHIN